MKVLGKHQVIMQRTGASKREVVRVLGAFMTVMRYVITVLRPLKTEFVIGNIYCYQPFYVNKCQHQQKRKLSTKERTMRNRAKKERLVKTKWVPHKQVMKERNRRR